MTMPFIMFTPFSSATAKFNLFNLLSYFMDQGAYANLGTVACVPLIGLG
jgi:hypothetical protein